MGAFTCLDLFSGAAGAWTLGLHRAGFRTVAAAEADPWRREMFAKRWGVHVYADVREITADAWDGARPFLVCGSPPCQHISAANTRGRGVLGDRLFFEAARIADELRPTWIAFENSDRLPARGYDSVAASLEGAGYDLWPVILGAGHAGAAHRRNRIFVIGRLSASADTGQGRTLEQSSGLGCLGADADRNGGQMLSGDNMGGRKRSAAEGAGDDRIGVGGISADADGAGLRIEQGRRCWPDGARAPISLDPGAGLGPVGTASLASYLRAYAGIPRRLAERWRAAFGDAIPPQITEVIGHAILALEADEMARAA